MALFQRRKTPHWNVSRFYAIDSSVKREEFISLIVPCVERFANSSLKNFTIHGTNGTPKGRSVGIRSFKNRIEKAGLQDSWKVYGELPGEVGFSVSFGVGSDPSTEMCILVIWAKISEYPKHFPRNNIVELNDSFPIQYGYELMLPKDLDVHNEGKIKHSFFSFSISHSPDMENWLGRVHKIPDGEVRDVYAVNYFNSKQVEALEPIGIPSVTRVSPSMSLVEFHDNKEREACIRKFRERNRTEQASDGKPDTAAS